jgi:hypothetical protein
MVTDLTSYFGWEDRCDFVNALQESLVEAQCSRFERVVRALRTLDANRAEKLIERFSRLPEQSFLRVFMAPETGYRLGYDGADHSDRTAAYLESVLFAEELRLGLVEHRGGPVWSALGDTYVPGKDGIASEAHEECTLSFDPRRTYVAPVVDGIVVDFASPNALGKLVHVAGDAAPMSAGNALTSLERVQRAIRLIDRASAGARAMFGAFTSVIIVRYDPSARNFYTSASTTFCLKRPVLRNPFVPSATISEIADGLVHEAIHCVCDAVEIREFRWLTGDERSPELSAVKIRSPWTERPLDLHTYLQACWVWYGLWNFWLAALSTEAHDAAETVRCASRAYRGFHGGAALERLESARVHVLPAVVEALAEAQSRVLNEVRALNLIPA